MEPYDLLRRIAGVFERLGLPYLVTGSTATIFYGEPRFTADIDGRPGAWLTVSRGSRR